MTKRIIFITGANGFIGRNLCAFLRKKGYFVRGAVRDGAHNIPELDEFVRIGDINELTDWREVLSGVDTVVHLAARAHIMNDTALHNVEAFHRLNVLGTGRLAQMAAKAGVQRLIFISSVKVNGDGALRVYTENDTPDPQDTYGISKRESEDLLVRTAAETGLKVVVLRLPLVYGPGVKANFRNLIKIAGSGLPLPLKDIGNKRSFLYIGNLVDAINVCIVHPLAAGETFMVSDGQDVSTPDLIKMIAGEMKKKAFLFLVPIGILKALCKIMGKTEELEKLTGTLIVDSGKIRDMLGWKPPFTIEEGIKETVRSYKKT